MVNLAKKYSDKVDERFSVGSQALAGTSDTYKFTGAVSYTHLDVYKRQAMGRNTPWLTFLWRSATRATKSSFLPHFGSVIRKW